MFKSILNILKIIGALSVFTVAMWGVFKFYNGIQRGQEEILTEIEYIQVDQGFLSEDLVRIQDTLDDIINHQKKQDMHMNDMQAAAKFYIRNQKNITEEAMEEAIEIMLKKNTDPIVLADPN